MEALRKENRTSQFHLVQWNRTNVKGTIWNDVQIFSYFCGITCIVVMVLVSFSKCCDLIMVVLVIWSDVTLLLPVYLQHTVHFISMTFKLRGKFTTDASLSDLL